MAKRIETCRTVVTFSSYLPDEGESLGADFITSLLSHYRRHFASQCNDRLQSSRIGLLAFGHWTAKQSDDGGATAANRKYFLLEEMIV